MIQSPFQRWLWVGCFGLTKPRFSSPLSQKKPGRRILLRLHRNLLDRLGRLKGILFSWFSRSLQKGSPCVSPKNHDDDYGGLTNTLTTKGSISKNDAMHAFFGAFAFSFSSWMIALPTALQKGVKRGDATQDFKQLVHCKYLRSENTVLPRKGSCIFQSWPLAESKHLHAVSAGLILWGW